MGQLTGKVAVITGASRGLGLAIAQTYAREGAAVVIAARSRTQIDKVVEELRQSGAQASGVPCDVGDLAQVRALGKHAVDTFGKIDIWVNNAGIASVFGPTSSIPVERFEMVVRTNILGTYYGSMVALEHMLPRKTGKLINLLGRGDDGPVKYQNAYASSKIWINSFTKALSQEHKSDGVGIFAFNPGLVDTDMLRQLEAVEGYEAKLKPLSTVIRWWANDPDVPANKALWLASSATDGKTGLVVKVLNTREVVTGLLRDVGRRLTRQPGRNATLSITSIPATLRVEPQSRTQRIGVMPLNRRTAFELLALVPIVILALVLRCGWAGVNSFAGDEARISLDALRMRHEFVLAGQQSSVNIPFLPLSVWVYALPYRLSSDPLVATQFTAALNVLTVIGVWGLARKWNAGAGWVAALFLAASPYGVFYARSIWQPNLLAPLATLWLWLAYLAATRSGRARSISIAACVAVGLSVVQVHFAGAALIVGTAYLFFRRQWYKSLIPVIVGGAVALIFALPYLYYITVIDPAVLTRFGSVAGGQVEYSLDSFANLTRLALNWDWGYLGKGDFDTYGRDPFAPLLVGLLLVNGAVGLVRELFAGMPFSASSLAHWWRGRDLSRPYKSDAAVGARLVSPAPEEIAQPEGGSGKPLPTIRSSRVLAECVLLLLLIAGVTFIRHTSPVLIHYQLIALPAVALLIGAGMNRARSETQLLTAAIALTVAVIWTLQSVNTLNYAAINRPPNSALSSILRESRDVAYASDTPILMFTHGDVAAIDGEVAVFETLLWDQPHRVINGDVLLILPPEPTTLIATLAPFQMWEELTAAGLALDVREFPRREGALPFMTARYDGVSDPQGFTLIDPVTFADGTTLEGWRARWVGNRFRISTLWRAGELTQAGVVQQFHHLRTADTREGEPFMGSDVPLSLHTWRTGDRVIVMADFFDVPPGDSYTLDLGHYTLPDLQRIARSDGESLVSVTLTVPPPEG